MRHLQHGFGAIALTILVARPPAMASPGDWVGSERCGSCHPGPYASWVTSRHATTAQRIPAQPQARCLSCHATGDAPAGAVVEARVGCEACHGPGAGYAEADVMMDRPLALLLGLWDLGAVEARTATCARCHRPGSGTRLEPIDLTLQVHPPQPGER